ncbi:organomercurial lyase [Streptomyces sp. NPDC059009]|uniref:organomercurial lyase n=1 Tax=Streptomyces sp. NPDC059009 TaxID=3346694 RepID=UPI0036CBD123
MQLQGQRRYGWCAMDVLMFPVVFKEPAAVTSRCATTGEPITLTVTPNGVRDLTPTTAAVTIAPAAGAEGSASSRGSHSLPRASRNRARLSLKSTIGAG